MKNKFAVGDKVRVVSDGDERLPVGAVVEIVDVDDSSIPYRAKYRGGMYWFRPSELEALTEYKFSPGDRVRVLRDCEGDLEPGTLGTVTRRDPRNPADNHCYIRTANGAEFWMMDSELERMVEVETTAAPPPPPTTLREEALAALRDQLKSEDPDVVRRAAEILLAVTE